MSLLSYKLLGLAVVFNAVAYVNDGVFSSETALHYMQYGACVNDGGLIQDGATLNAIQRALIVDWRCCKLYSIAKDRSILLPS